MRSASDQLASRGRRIGAIPASLGPAEQPALPARPLVGGAGGVGEDRLGGGEQRGAIGREAVERTGGGEAFDLAAVEQPRVDPLGEIVEAG